MKAFKSSKVMNVLLMILAVNYAMVAPAAADAQAGKAKSAACAACHGADGNSMAPNFPKLAGQNEKYLLKQLLDYQTGARQDSMMAGMVAGKSEQDLADLAAYFAAQTPSKGEAKKELLELGEQIYRGGNSDTSVTACIACHGPRGKGVAAAGFPALAGQHAQYTADQLKAFRAAGRDDSQGKRRENDGDTKIMRSVASAMSDKEIEAVSSYISGLY